MVGHQKPKEEVEVVTIEDTDDEDGESGLDSGDYREFRRQRDEGNRKIIIDETRKCHGNFRRVIINVSS